MDSRQPLTAKTVRKPLVYHWPTPRNYGRGICGSYGMMAGSIEDVTCDKCRRSKKLPKQTPKASS